MTNDDLKAPEIEYHRRSWFARLRHRPLLFSGCLMLIGVGVSVAGLKTLEATGQLPRQRRERAAIAAMTQFVRTPAFDRTVVAPIRAFLAANVSVDSDTLERRFRTEHPTGASKPIGYVRPSRSAVAVTEQWRDRLQDLESRGVNVFALQSELRDAGNRLRLEVAARLSHPLADGNALSARPSDAMTEIAAAAVRDQLGGLSENEFNAIAFLAYCAQEVPRGSGGATASR